jgi:hypothetical protein
MTKPTKEQIYDKGELFKIVNMYDLPKDFWDSLESIIKQERQKAQDDFINKELRELDYLIDENDSEDLCLTMKAHFQLMRDRIKELKNHNNSHVGKQDRNVLPYEATSIKGVLDESGETDPNKNRKDKSQ